MDLSNLPANTIIQIALDLSDDEVSQMCDTNSRLNQILCENPNYWRQRYVKYFGPINEASNDPQFLRNLYIRKSTKVFFMYDGNLIYHELKQLTHPLIKDFELFRNMYHIMIDDTIIREFFGIPKLQHIKPRIVINNIEKMIGNIALTYDGELIKIHSKDIISDNVKDFDSQYRFVFIIKNDDQVEGLHKMGNKMDNKYGGIEFSGPLLDNMGNKIQIDKFSGSYPPLVLDMSGKLYVIAKDQNGISFYDDLSKPVYLPQAFEIEVPQRVRIVDVADLYAIDDRGQVYRVTEDDTLDPILGGVDYIEARNSILTMFRGDEVSTLGYDDQMKNIEILGAEKVYSSGDFIYGIRSLE